MISAKMRLHCGCTDNLNDEHLEVLMKWSDSGIIGLLRFLEKAELSPPSRRAVANASVIIRQITD